MIPPYNSLCTSSNLLPLAVVVEEKTEGWLVLYKEVAPGGVAICCGWLPRSLMLFPGKVKSHCFFFSCAQIKNPPTNSFLQCCSRCLEESSQLLSTGWITSKNIQLNLNFPTKFKCIFKTIYFCSRILPHYLSTTWWPCILLHSPWLLSILDSYGYNFLR